MQSREEPLPGWGLGECPTAPRPGELPLAIELLQPRQIQPSKTPRENADGQEEVRPTWDPTRAIRGQAPRGQDAMEVRVMVQLLASGVEDSQAADLRAKVLGVPRDVLEGLRHRVKEQTVELAGVLQR
jgi:hypothetical protein